MQELLSEQDVVEIHIAVTDKLQLNHVCQRDRGKCTERNIDASPARSGRNRKRICGFDWTRTDKEYLQRCRVRRVVVDVKEAIRGDILTRTELDTLIVEA